MRTKTYLSAATPRCWCVALLAICVCSPGVSGQGPSDEGNPSHNAFYGQSPKPLSSEFGLAQEAQSQTTQVSSPAEQAEPAKLTSELALANLPPETQGDLLMIHQRYLAAIAAYQRGPKDSPVVWNKLGIAYQHMYALDFAKAQYEKALFLNPKYSEALNNLGTVYYGEKDYRKAENFYKKALKLKPNTASFYSNLGTAYFAEHKYKQGMESYQRAFAIDPNIFINESVERIAENGPVEEQAQLNYELAKLYASAGNMEAALKYLRLAFMDGFDDVKKLMAAKEFAALREKPEFRLLLAEEHIDLKVGDQKN
ncbi:MAG: tetratricopeptide repeat protein [Acidobacteriaceae bacterium]|nr:tetratricopeptide repeat protein [Acidobacteriaceae bacterium]